MQGLGNPPGVDKEKTMKDQSLKEITFPVSYQMTFNWEQFRIIPRLGSHVSIQNLYITNPMTPA